jgi:hypothetical protein
LAVLVVLQSVVLAVHHLVKLAVLGRRVLGWRVMELMVVAVVVVAVLPL